MLLSMRFTPHDIHDGQYILEREFDRFRNFVISCSCKCILVREEGHDNDDDKRPHCHLLIWYNKTKSTFGQKFHLYMNKQWSSNVNVYVGNVDFSIKDEDQSAMGDKPFWYICKGLGLGKMPNVLYKVDYDEKDIEAFHIAGWNYVNDLKSKKVNVSHKKVVKEKKDPDTFVMRCAKDLKERYPRNSEKYGGWNFQFKADRNLVYDAVCDNLGELGKTLDDIIIYRIMGGVMMVLDKASAKGLFHATVMNKFDNLAGEE